MTIAVELFEQGAVTIAKRGREVALITDSGDDADTLFEWLVSVKESSHRDGGGLAMSIPTRAELAQEVERLYIALSVLVEVLDDSGVCELPALKNQLSQLEKKMAQHRADVLHPEES